MTRPDKERGKKPALTGHSKQLSLDVALAARTDVPVLISAKPENALSVAQAIVKGSGAVAAELVFVDAATSDLKSTVIDASLRGQLSTIVFREVHAFGPDQQHAILEVLAERRRKRGQPAFRVISTSSVPLFDRVMEGSFSSRLFYILNAIHIIP